MTTRPQSSSRAFIKRHAVLVFYVLVFALAFGPALILGGPRAFFDSSNFATGGELTTSADLGPLMLVAIMAGPPIYTLLAVLVTGLTFGRAGLRGLLSRTLHWRVGFRWHVLALLTAPLLWVVIQGALSFTSNAYTPGIVTADDKSTLLVTALAAGLIAGFFEEIAWTGFAAHELLKRHGLIATGLIVGLLWCLLHLPLYGAASSGDLPRWLTLPVSLFSWLLPYRMLMVWVYSRTRSVLIAVLMHIPLSSMSFIFGSAAMVGMPDLIFNLIFGAVLWAAVAAVAITDRRKKALATGVVAPPGHWPRG